MTVHRLASKENPLLKKIRLISSGARRAPEESVIAEGIRVLEEVEKADCAIEAVVVSELFGEDAREEKLLERWESRHLHIYRTDGKIFKTISGVLSPQGALALVRIPQSLLEEIIPDNNPLILFACGIQDPGNLGTLIRTAVASGCTQVCTMKGTVSARNPKTIRASAGAFFHIPVVEQTDILSFRRHCSARSIQMYRTNVHNGLSYTMVDMKSRCAIVLGNEGSGLDEEQFADVPGIRIPMADKVESLNVAAAGAIILFEAFNQRLNQNIT